MSVFGHENLGLTFSFFVNNSSPHLFNKIKRLNMYGKKIQLSNKIQVTEHSSKAHHCMARCTGKKTR